jgi:YD repeat-containing protein
MSIICCIFGERRKGNELPTSYIYDLNGNLTSDGTRGFDYDDENQLIRVTVTNSWKSEFTYDGKFRRRIRKEYAWQNSAWAQTAEVRYIYDGMLVIQDRDGNNLPTVMYTRGRDLSGSLQDAGGIGGLLARTEAANGQSAWYHADGNGNVTAMINAQQIGPAQPHIS